MTVRPRRKILWVPLLKAHFDGRAIVLDEPANLVAGPAVHVIVEAEPAVNPAEPTAVDLAELARRTDEALQPTRQAFAESGMTDGELSEFLEIETHAMRGVPYERK